MTSQLLVDPASRTWRRRLGPLPWAVLEELALQAQPSPHGWDAAVGVRHLGAAVGITKDTAARALASLRSAGLVMPARVHLPKGPSRSGYRLNLPDGISIRSCPNNQDTPQHDNGASPNGEDTRRLDGGSSLRPNGTGHVNLGNADDDKGRSATHINPEDDDPLAVQPTLFELDDAGSCGRPRSRAEARMAGSLLGDG
jgi:hypothetical protein